MGYRLCQDVQYIHTVSPQGPYSILWNRYTWGNSLYICVYIIILQYSIWMMKNKFSYVCMFSILHGNNNDSFNTEYQNIFYLQPWPKQTQAIKLIKFSCKYLFICCIDYTMTWSNDMLSSNKIWAADMMLKNIILIYGMVNLFF